MLLIGLVITFLTGLSLLNLISRNFSVLEKAGLSFLTGLALQTLLMLVMDALGLELNRFNILTCSVLLCLGLNIPVYLKHRQWPGTFGQIAVKLPSLNFIWLLFMVLVIYLEYMNFVKCMYYPTFDRDSLAGFDTIGWIVSQEHTFRNLSIFQKDYVPAIQNAGSYITYMPMLQLSYAYVYILGAATSKIIPALVFLSFLISFYAVTSKFVGHTGAAAATFFVLITPEMIAFSSLSATNVVHAAYASLGVGYMALWFCDRKSMYWQISVVLLAANLWIRNEGVVFIGAAILVMLIRSWKEKPWRFLLKYGLLCISPMVVWVLFMKIYGIRAEGIIITHPFWDVAKMGMIWNYFKSHWFNQQYYGLSFALFALAVIANSWFLIRKKDQLYLVLMILFSMLFYMVILYQIDYIWDSIQNVLAYSAKRFMFCFIPLLWLYVVSSHWGKLLFQWLEKFLNYKKI